LAVDIAKSAKKGDITFEKNNLKVFLEQKASSMFSGATIDFTEEQGFVVMGAPQGSCCD
jgi:Fe-S cluster assembly iron-binding protein IscA